MSKTPINRNQVISNKELNYKIAISMISVSWTLKNTNGHELEYLAVRHYQDMDIVLISQALTSFSLEAGVLILGQEGNKISYHLQISTTSLC